jgi:3-phenylpropionate/trans-cinnamate dioxygenase ferredoxin reductase subunit
MGDETRVVVGASLAGARAVEAMRDAGAGGRMVLIGEEQDLPYERPELSKGYLAGQKERAELPVLEDGWYAEHDVELMLGRTVTAIDRAGSSVLLDGGERIGYDQLLLATGSAVRPLNLPGADLPGVLYLRRVADSDAIRAAIATGRPMLVIGGGWIGLEVAAVARSAGVEVTLLEVGPTPLAGVVGPEVGERFATLHREHGVRVLTGVGVRRLVGGSAVTGVELEDGAVIPAEVVVAGVGVRPRTELAEAAGLPVDGGVLVDSRLRTADPAIWAAGDIAAAENPWIGGRLRVEHFANANDQGALAGRIMAGADEEWAQPPFFWSDQYDVGLEYRGWADPRTARLVTREAGDGGWLAFWLDGEDRVSAALHVNRWDDADTIDVLVRERAAVDPARLADPQIDWAQVRA